MNNFLLISLRLLCLVFLLSGCQDPGTATTPSPSAAIRAEITSSGLSTTTITLTNSAQDTISSFPAPEFSSSLADILQEDSIHSTCNSVTLPLASGDSCTYVFAIKQGATTVPGTYSGTITLSANFTDNPAISLTFPARFTNYLYAGNATGVYQWNGAAWSNVGNGISKITTLLKAADSNTIYSGSATGNAGSDVQEWNGITWTTVQGSSGLAPVNVNALATNNTNAVLTGNATGVSSFMNNAWSALGGNIGAVQALVVNTAANALYAGGTMNNAGVQQYNGADWSALGTDIPTHVNALALDSNTGVLYAGSNGNTSSTAADVNQYENGAWSAAGVSTLPPIAVKALALDSTGNLYAASSYNTSWVISGNSPNGKWSSVASSTDGSHLAAAINGGGIYTSADSGATWARSSAPTEAWTSIASSADGNHLVAVTNGDGIYTYNPTNGWQPVTDQTLPDSAVWTSITSSADGNHLAAAASGYEIYTSADFGVTWTRSSGASGFWSSIASSADGIHLVAAMSEGGIYTSADSGSTWAPSSAPEKSWSAIASSMDGSHLAAVTNGDGIYTYDSTNGWQSVSDPTLPGSAAWTSIASSADGSHLAAVAHNGGIYTSANYGATWTLASVVSTAAPWQSIASSADGAHLVAVVNNNTGSIFASQESDVNEFFPNGESWIALIGSGLMPTSVNTLIIDSANNVYTASTNSASGADVNEFQKSNQTWVPLNNGDVPQAVTTLTLGPQLTISFPAS